MRVCPRGDSGGRDVLLIDDSRANRHLIERQLARSGFRVALCTGGEAALARLARRRFDAALLDWAMPDLSGLETLRAIRALDANGSLPVLMMTPRGDAAASAAALEAGADDHLAKPFAFDLLTLRLERLLARTRVVAAIRRADRVSAGTSARG